MGMANKLRHNFRAWHPKSPHSVMAGTTPGSDSISIEKLTATDMYAYPFHIKRKNFDFD